MIFYFIILNECITFYSVRSVEYQKYKNQQFNNYEKSDLFFTNS